MSITLIQTNERLLADADDFVVVETQLLQQTQHGEVAFFDLFDFVGGQVWNWKRWRKDRKSLLVPSTRKSVNMETFGTESNNELEKISVLSLFIPWKASG